MLVAFGTSVPEARKVFDHIDARAKERFAGYDIRWAFTSSFIRKKLAKQGIVTLSPDQVVANLQKEGVSRAVFQSLHIAPGQEFKEIESVDTGDMEISIGSALLTDDEDINQVVRILGKNRIGSAANIIVAHGNEHKPQFNKQLIAFTKVAETRHKNTWVCSVEGQPGTESLKIAKQKAGRLGKVNFIPLMIVAGDHILNDVMGDEADSWKTVIGAKKTTCAKPLGYNDKILEIYFNHIDEAMKKLK